MRRHLPRPTMALAVSIAIGCGFPDVEIEATSTQGVATTGTAGSGAVGGGQGASGGAGAGSVGGAGGGGDAGNGGKGGQGGSPSCGTVESCDLDCDLEKSVDCGGLDCDDDDDQVYSTQGSWFTIPRRNGGTFDYDCSGEEDQLYTTHVCSAALGLCPIVGPGFLVDVAAQVPVPCGQSTSFGTCTIALCKQVTSNDTVQACH